MMTTFQTEGVDECRKDILPLLHAHWSEVALYRDKIELAPDFARYQAAEDAGTLFVVTARDGGALIGYAVFFMSLNLHYRHSIVAMNDVVFVSRDRRGIVGARLIQNAERLLCEFIRARSPGNVFRIMWHVKTRQDWSPLLERMGYGREEVVMGKVFDGR